MLNINKQSLYLFFFDINKVSIYREQNVINFDIFFSIKEYYLI